MYKTCVKCGKIHKDTYKCKAIKRIEAKTDEAELRNTNKWHNKSMEIRERASFMCEVCRDEGRYTYNNLEVHHITKLKVAPHLLTDDTNLVCLCTYHHKLADAGFIDADYLRELAARRDSA